MLLPLPYIVSVLKSIIHSRVHVVMVKSHEKRVDHDAQGDEEVNEGIKYDERQVLK